MRATCTALVAIAVLVAGCPSSHTPDERDAGTTDDAPTDTSARVCVPLTTRSCVPVRPEFTCCHPATEQCTLDGRGYGECAAPCGIPCDAGPGFDATLHIDAAMQRCPYGGGCDLLGHDCPTGQACRIGDTASECVAEGAAHVGDACTAQTDCAGQTLCVSGAPTSRCLAIACAPSDCAPGQTYRQLGGADGAPLPNGIGFCDPEGTCTPIPALGCAAGAQCIVTGSDGSTACAPTGPLVEGQRCDTGSGCEAGLGCYTNTPGGATCWRFCRLGVAGDCVHGTCASLGWPTYGLCM